MPVVEEIRVLGLLTSSPASPIFPPGASPQLMPWNAEHRLYPRSVTGNPLRSSPAFNYPHISLLRSHGRVRCRSAARGRAR